MHRWVNAGSSAIGLIRKGTGGKPYIQNVHDVADTHPVRGGKNPWLWKMDEEYQSRVVARLAEQFGSPEGANLGDAIMEAVSRVVDENYGEYLRDLHYEVADSFLEELDELNTEVLFRNTMKASVQYAVLTRCGLDASQYIDDEDLIGISVFRECRRKLTSDPTSETLLPVCFTAETVCLLTVWVPEKPLRLWQRQWKAAGWAYPRKILLWFPTI